MSQLSIQRTPDIIALEINSIKEQTRIQVLFNSIEIGRRLTEAKELVPHGEWGEWLEKSVEYSKSTSNNLMRIFEEYGSEQIALFGNNAKSQALGNLSYTQALSLLGIPSEKREDFIKDNDVDNMSTRELQQAIKKNQELEEELKVANKEAEKQKRDNEIVSEKLSTAIYTNSKNIEHAQKLKKEIETIESKNKEALTNKEVEIENFKIHIQDIKKKQLEANSSGDSKEAGKLQEILNDKESELIEANRKIEELKQLLNDKPIDVIAEPQTIDKIPEAIENELQELRGFREKVNQASINNNSSAKFEVYFEALIKNFQELIVTISDVEDGELKVNYKNAINGLINKMRERL